MDIFSRVKNCIEGRISSHKLIFMDTNLKDLGLDSLEIVDLMLQLESEFNLVFDNDDFYDIVYIKDIVNLINRKTKEENLLC